MNRDSLSSTGGSAGAVQQAEPRAATCGSGGWSGAAAFVAPFAVYVGAMAAEQAAGLPLAWSYPARCGITALALILFSRRLLSPRASITEERIPWPRRVVASVAVGAAMFLIWIGPDVLFGPGYRHSWVFENVLLGRTGKPAAGSLKANLAFIAVRTFGCVAIVPVIEELFWRGWLMRWLVSRDFRKVPIGAYTASAFWITAALFACEHGAFWEVGLAAGIVYNWWVVRTRSLADCIVAHATTNGLLSAYVLIGGNWQYWM